MQTNSNPEALDSAESKKPWLKAGLVLAVLFSVVFFWYSKPVYHGILGMQAARQAEKAEVAMDMEDWRAAGDVLAKAYRRAPREPAVLSALARFYGKVDLKRQQFFLDRLYEAEQADDADLRDLARLDMNLGDTGRALKILGDLLEREPEEKENLELASWIEYRRNNLPDAEGYMDRVLAADPTDEDARFKLAVLRTESMFESKAEAAWKDIWEIAKRDDVTGLSALGYLRERRTNELGAAREVYQLIEKHPLASESDVVKALSKYYRALSDPAERDRLVAEVVAEREGIAPEDMIEFVRWLDVDGRAKELLEVFSYEPNLDSPELTAIFLSAAKTMRRRDLIQRAFDRSEQMASLSERMFLRAQCVAYLGDESSMVRSYLKDCYLQALENQEWAIIARVATFAERRGLLVLARSAYETLAQSPELGFLGLTKLLAFAQQDKDAVMIRDLSREMLRRSPQNRRYAKLACYMDLLVGSRMEVSADAAQVLAEASPDDGESRLLIAFGHYRMGNLAAAKAECARVNVRELPPSYRAVAAAILGAVGEKVAAVSVSEELPKSLLLNEEMSLISPWLPIY